MRKWQVAAKLIYGQVKKNYRGRKLVRVTPVMRLGTLADLTIARPRLGFSGRLNTAYVERVNLTIRHGLAALARRTWATAQQSPHLLAHLEWWRAYDHGCRALTKHCEWCSCSHESAVVNWRRNAIGNGLQPWRRGERTDDGRRAKCCAIPYRRCHASSCSHEDMRRCPVNEHEGLGEDEIRDRSGDVEDDAPSLGLPIRRNPARHAFSGGSSNYPPRPMAAPPSR